jgi:hypothetical protein
VPCCTPSTTPKAGISSPAACVEISNLPPDIALTLLGEHFGRAEDGVQRLREAGGQAPADGGLRVHGRRDAGGQHAGDACVLDE